MSGEPTVLLVDDEPMVLCAIDTFLSLETAYRVVSFTCPVRALEYLETHRVDAVVCDLLMQSMCGQEFLSRVRARDASLPCVMLTGVVDEAQARAGRACKGLFGFLRKPWSNEELQRVIERAVGARSRRTGGTARSSSLPPAD